MEQRVVVYSRNIYPTFSTQSKSRDSENWGSGMSDDVADLCGKVFLVACDANDKIVRKETLRYDEYYGESHAMIDDDRYRLQYGICCVTGRIYDLDGQLDQEFVNHYGDKGEYVRSRIVHRDGTVIED